MALASLRFRRDDDHSKITDKHGQYLFDGDAASFHEWQFRVQMKMSATEKKDRPTLSAKIVDGLRGDAFSIAMDIGPPKILNDGGIDILIATFRSGCSR